VSGRGTEGSNPAPSSGESRANLTRHRSSGIRRSQGRDGRRRFTGDSSVGRKRAKRLDDDRECLLGCRRRNVEIEDRANGAGAGRQHIEPAPMRLLHERCGIEILQLEPHDVGLDCGRINEDPVKLG
jgi:hypothetical protein